MNHIGKHIRIFAAVAVLALVSGRAFGQAWGQVGGQSSHVRASLVADVSGVAAGKAFVVGVMLKIDPGWHIYWKNPGDAGLPTVVKWNLPSGYSVGELRYPTPRRFVLPGDIICYGYEDTVMLMADVTPGAAEGTAAAGSVADIGATVSWLVCADVCIPGKQMVDLKLAGAGGGAANEDLFKFWEKQVPVDVAASGLGDVTSWTVRRVSGGDSGAAEYELDIQWKTDVPDRIDFLPGELEGYEVQNVRVNKGDKKAQVSFGLRPLTGAHDLSATMEAVVGYSLGNDWRGVNVRFAISKS